MHAGQVERVIGGLAAPDVVVLDPPRSGAGRAVCEAIAAAGPSTVVYVACDPAALGRDTAIMGAAGYELSGLRAFDAFPQTHHVECVARFERRSDACVPGVSWVPAGRSPGPANSHARFVRHRPMLTSWHRGAAPR